MGSAGSGMCELTNQSRLGIWKRGALKRQEPEASVFQTEGGYSTAALDSMRRLLVVFLFCFVLH